MQISPTMKCLWFCYSLHIVQINQKKTSDAKECMYGVCLKMHKTIVKGGSKSGLDKFTKKKQDNKNCICVYPFNSRKELGIMGESINDV